jgi:hypothetical protein
MPPSALMCTTIARPHCLCANCANGDFKISIWYSTILAVTIPHTRAPSSSKIDETWVKENKWARREGVGNQNSRVQYSTCNPLAPRRIYINFISAGVLMDLLSECFPRVLCRARDCLFEAIGRLTALSECQGQTQIQCRLCSVKVLAQKGALYGHLNQHPSYRSVKRMTIDDRCSQANFPFNSDAKSANSLARMSVPNWNIKDASIQHYLTWAIVLIVFHWHLTFCWTH